MIGRDIVVIGGSAGAVSALRDLLGLLPRELNAAIFIVIHIGQSAESRLPEVLSRAGKLPATWARDGESIEHGHVYVAPADRHLLLEPGRLRLAYGPKENYTRPAIDPLFRSAAIAYGLRVVGVLLSGYLDDGSAGLQAIKDRGGVTIVQDPAEALVSQMPESALACVAVDHCLKIEEVATMIVRYDPPALDCAPCVPDTTAFEHKLTTMGAMLAAQQELNGVGAPSAYACPECGGALYQMKDERLLRFRCGQAHAWSALSLLSAIARSREEAASSMARLATEQAELLNKIAQQSPSSKRSPPKLADPAMLAKQAQALQSMLRAGMST